MSRNPMTHGPAPRAIRRATRYAIGCAMSCATLMLLGRASLRAQTAPASHAATIDAMGDVPARVAVREILDGAPARGIPVEPLLTKVREGIAKRSNPDRIRDAVQTLSRRLEQAHGALDPVYSVAELSAGASAIQIGVPVRTLQELRFLSPATPLTVPLGVLTEMIADGVPARPAAEKVKQLVGRGATSKHLIAMGAEVRADVASGMAPGTALELRSKRVISLLVNPSQPAFGQSVGPASPPSPPPIRPPRR